MMSKSQEKSHRFMKEEILLSSCILEQDYMPACILILSDDGQPAFHLLYLKRLYTSLQILNVLEDGHLQYPLLNRCMSAYFHLVYLNQVICQPVSLMTKKLRSIPACILTISDLCQPVSLLYQNGPRVIHFENGSVVDDPDGIVDSSTVFLQQLQASYPELMSRLNKKVISMLLQDLEIDTVLHQMPTSHRNVQFNVAAGLGNYILFYLSL
ncbi:unnamed protein product [Mytilus coruscus]|uniref:Uncharacterized protein n=1 Tax=Mytilus coruscus TaxID=42192 RepID=A0A6J8DLK8_MYTCO|nr:unnamed protein product [Mytilus coruscus]